MGLFELLLKRRRFLPLFERVWDVVSPHLAITAGPEAPVAHRLACFYYGSVVYAGVFQAARAAGMSPSSGHALARLQLGHYPFDAALKDAVDDLFTAAAGTPEGTWSETLTASLSRIVALVKGGGDGADHAVAAELEALERRFGELGLGGGGLYPASSSEI